MPYARDHKQRTRARILDNARRLFAAQGFEQTTIAQVMRESRLTHGGFYAHFGSKAELYREALAASPAPQPQAPVEPPSHGLEALWRQCLAGGGAADSPWAFLATDAASRQPSVRAAYARRFEALAERLRDDAATAGGSERASLAAAALLIGTLAVALTVDDATLRHQLVQACREGTRRLCAAGEAAAIEPPEYFWSGGLGAAAAPPLH